MQHTLASAVRVSGIGLHTGKSVEVALHPAPAGTGVVFMGPASVTPVKAHVSNVVDTRLATSIGDANWSVQTIEHLLAALMGLGIDNVEIRVFGNELPILDGSAKQWIEAIDQAGVVSQTMPRTFMIVTDVVEVRDGDRSVRLSPGEGFHIQAAIDFDHPSVGQQSWEMTLTPDAFRRQIGWARTFGFFAQVEGLRRMGLIRGGSLDNAVVFGNDGVMNPEGLRSIDEPIRHKVLDMIGDLSLLGYPLQGRFEAERPGHALTRSLVDTMLVRRDCWCLIEGN